jgi:hypothetical protein
VGACRIPFSKQKSLTGFLTTISCSLSIPQPLRISTNLWIGYLLHLLNAIINLSRAIGVTINAEGVEEAYQVEYLREAHDTRIL